MAFTYDSTTDRGKVRLLSGDFHSEADAQIFQDADIDAFLELEPTIKAAAALAIETMATDEAMIQKVLKHADVETDGAATARVLLARARMLRQQSDDEAALDSAGIDWAEMVVNDYTYVERLNNEFLRELA